jgi:hypothetical protein
LTTTLNISRDFTEQDDRPDPTDRIDRTYASYKIWYLGSPPPVEQLFALSEARFYQSFDNSVVLDRVDLQLIQYAPFLHSAMMRAGGHAAPDLGTAKIDVVANVRDFQERLQREASNLAAETALPGQLVDSPLVRRLPVEYKVGDYVAITGHGDWDRKCGVVTEVKADRDQLIELAIRLDGLYIGDGTPRWVVVYAHQVIPRTRRMDDTYWQKRFAEEDAASVGRVSSESVEWLLNHMPSRQNIKSAKVILERLVKEVDVMLLTPPSVALDQQRESAQAGLDLVVELLNLQHLGSGTEAKA